MRPRIWPVAVFSLLFFFFSSAFSQEKGIYINMKTMRNKVKLLHFIHEAAKTGVNAFVIDYPYYDATYAQNIKLVKQNHLQYVARIVVFPGGGTPEQVHSRSYWLQRAKLITGAANLGADAIQLDYIRYNIKQPKLAKNITDIKHVIRYYRDYVDQYHLPLQIDVFGVAAHGPSYVIGQHLPAFAKLVNVVCPMVYPSHYLPYIANSKRPYKVIHGSLSALRKMFSGQPPFAVVPYLEAVNPRYKMTFPQLVKYIQQEIKAAHDTQSNGWYFWSASNDYEALFAALTPAHQ